jgi:hypothetical protein
VAPHLYCLKLGIFNNQFFERGREEKDTETAQGDNGYKRGNYNKTQENSVTHVSPSGIFHKKRLLLDRVYLLQNNTL